MNKISMMIHKLAHITLPACNKATTFLVTIVVVQHITLTLLYSEVQGSSIVGNVIQGL